jgi:carboxylate-amine ligase
MSALPDAVPAFRAFGVELEYMIVSRDTLDVRPLAGAALRALAGREDTEPPPADVPLGMLGWSNELVCHLLELKNPRPAPSLAELALPMASRIAEMNDLLEPMGARLMPGGMHPWMTPREETVLWPHDNAAIYSSYDRIFDCRSHGWANLQSQHLNLPFADDEQFARLHAATRLILPILPAIAASSPFIEGHDAGSVDMRLVAYCHHTDAVPSLTGAVIPDTAVSHEQYVRDVLEPMYRDIAPMDANGVMQKEWLNARGAIPRFDRSALEIRLLDVQECPAADLGISALVADAVRFLYEERCATLQDQQRFPTGALRAILVGCARGGDQMRIEDTEYLRLLGYAGEACTAATLWSDLAARMSAANMPLLATWRKATAHILDQGPLGKRLLKASGTDPGKERLFEVYQALCECLAEGRFFTG